MSDPVTWWEIGFAAGLGVGIGATNLLWTVLVAWNGRRGKP